MAEEEQKKSLKPAQIAASAMAAIAAAFLGSTLGVEGTVAGAGIASVISTVGSEFFVRSLQKGKQAAKKTLVAAPLIDTRLRQETAAVEPPGRRPLNPLVQRTVHPRSPGQPPAQRTAAQRTPPRSGQVLVPTQGVAAPPAGPGDQRVRHFPALNSRTGATAVPANSELRTDFLPRPEAPTRMLGTGPAGPTRIVGTNMPGVVPTQLVGPPGAAQPTGGDQGKPAWWKNRWVLAAGTSVVAFVIGMLALTGFEGITGKAVSGGAGTTFGQVVGRSHAGTGTPATKPTETVTETQTEHPKSTPSSGTEQSRPPSSAMPTPSSQAQQTGQASPTESAQPTDSAVPASP